MSVIFVDSACDLSAKQVKMLGMDMVKFPVFCGGKKAKENDITAIKNSDLMDIEITADAFVNAFTPYLDNGENILYLSTNQVVFNLTDVFNVARKELNEKYPNREIEIFNLSLSSTMAGVLLYEVGLMYKRGATDIEILRFVEEFKHSTRGYVVTNQMKFLKRCENFEQVNVKTGVGVNAIVECNINGCLIVEYVNGRKKALTQIAKLIENNSINLVDYTIQVGYFNQEQSATYFKNLIDEKYNNESKVFLQKICLANVSIYNPDTIIIGYHGKSI